MFGMSSKEFWEEEPLLYWSYRTFYMQKLKSDADMINYDSWLKGSYTYLAVGVALNNAFSKKKQEYPKKPFGKNEKDKPKTKLQEEMEKEPDKNIRQQIEYNYWARL